MPRHPTLRFRLVAAFCITASVGAGPAPSKEYQVKAGFLYNFGKFTTWPERARPDGKAPFVIGLLGDDPFGKILDVFEKKEIGGHRVAVRRLRRKEDGKTCHIVFVSRSERKRLDGILRTLKKSGVLTVSEIAGGARRGVMINFHLQRSKVRFEINRKAAAQAGLKINPKLLRLSVPEKR